MHRFYLFLVIVLTANTALSQNYIKKFTSIGKFITFNNQLFFSANDGESGMELWMSDGTEDGTVLVKDILPGYSGSNPTSLTIFKGELYFSARHEVYGLELWKTDGTAEGTLLVVNLAPEKGNNISSAPFNLTVFKDQLFFYASEDGYYSDIWKTDGTAEGTIKVFKSQSNSSGLTVAGDYLFFRYLYGELWKSDGTVEGTKKIDVDDYYYVDEFTRFNDELVFITHTSYRQKIRLYKLNPVDDSFILLKEFNASAYGENDIDNFKVINDGLFFSIRTDNGNYEYYDVLWKSDGTAEGTKSIKTFPWKRHMSESYIQNFTLYNNKLFFTNENSNSHLELWSCDGTETGTLKIKEIGWTLENLAESNGYLFFNGDGELWRSNGTEEGSAIFAEINPEENSNPSDLIDLDNTLYFTADDGTGKAVWSNKESSELNLTSNYSFIRNKSILQFESKVDSLVGKTVKIENTGKKELILSEISVTGTNFFVEGSLPKVIDPGKYYSLNVLYFPSKEGDSQGALKILSNDKNEGFLEVRLNGKALGKAADYSFSGYSLLKRINFEDSVKIKVSKNIISENLPKGTKVGILSVDNSSDIFIYKIISGKGDADNHSFIIENNILKSNKTFDFEKETTLSLNILATNGQDSVKQNIIISVVNINENHKYSNCSDAVTSFSYSLNDVEFVDDNHVVAIGSNGKILRSEDAGDSWIEVNSGINNNLSNLQFVTSSIGYIIGDDVLLKTEDGGKSWFLLQRPNTTYPYLRNFFFVTTETGYVFGGDGKIFKTIDGGRSWRSLSNYSDHLNAGYFITKEKGFICGTSNTLIRTLDGGKTWENIDMESFGWNIAFSDIIFTSALIGYISTNKGTVIKTIDGGQTWSAVGETYSNYATRIYFKNENEGYVIGSWSGSTIQKTTDGGQTWSFDPSIRGGSLMGISINHNGKMCLVGLGTSLGSTSEPGRVIFTKEGNGEFKTVCQFFPEDYNSIQFTNNKTGFIFGSQNFNTTDGGITWLPFQLNTTDAISDATFVDEKTGYAITQWDIFKTTNSGETWVKVDEDNTLGDSWWMKKIYFLNSDIGFVHGWNGKIFKTINGGITWGEIISGTDNIVNDIKISNNVGYAVGSGGMILKSTDAGNSWVGLNSSTSQWLNTVHIINDSTVIAGGLEKTLLKTNDGGITWNSVKIISDIIGFKSFHFQDELNGYAICGEFSGGDIYKTSDGGSSWEGVITSSNHAYDLWTIENTLLYVGQRGIINEISSQDTPIQPGYISGENNIYSGIEIDYSVPELQGVNSIWSVSGGQVMNYWNNNVRVYWEQPGTYYLSVLFYNSCGIGEKRELTVLVDSMPNPKIIGNDTAVAFSINQKYFTTLKDTHSYLWKVSGEKKFSGNLNEVSVDWDKSGNGKIEVLETSLVTGARAFATLNVIIIGDTIPNGFEPRFTGNAKFYPNPSLGIINFNIESKVNGILEINFYDQKGIISDKFNFNKASFNYSRELNIANLPTGVYMMEVKLGAERIIKKVIKI
ncbi:MAG TPA: ELWxxDGT repeat protein [Cytophagales bacterium]|nr:ELWxxDGT repeat protein [Cytophagales bacterium]